MNNKLLRSFSIKGIATVLFCFFLSINFQLKAQVTPPSWMWVNSGTTTGSYSYSAGIAIDTVSTNSVFWGGRFGGGNYSFSSQSGPAITGSFGCSSQLGTAQITTAGGVTNWVQSVPCVGQDYGDGVAADNAGNSYVSGLTQGGNNPFVGAVGPTGAYRWSHNETSLSGRSYGCEVDRVTQSLYVATDCGGNGTIGGVAVNTGGLADAQNLTKYDVNGNTIWSRTTVGGAFCGPRRVAVDKNGAHIYVNGGYSGGSPTFGTVTPPNPGGVSNLYIADYDANGNCLAVATAVNAGVPDWTMSCAVACDANRNVYVTGYFQGTATFGNISITSIGGYDIYIAKYNFFASKWEWARREGGAAGDDGATGISLDKDGDVYVAGSFHMNATFDIGGANVAVTAGGAPDNAFVAKYANSTGDFQYVQTPTTSGGNGMSGSGVVCDKNKQVYFSGGYGGTPNFGAFSAVNCGGGANGGNFVAKLDRVANNMSIVPNPAASYTVTNTYVLPYTETGTFTAGNVYTAQLSDALGSFNTPVNIGSVASTTSGNISITIPCVPPSPYYKIRIISSAPHYSSVDLANTFVSIVNPIIATISPNATSCVGGNNTLTVTGTGPFTWSPGTDLNTTSGASVICTPSAIGTITYTVTSTAAYNGCFGTNTVSVTATGTPTLASVSASPATVCAGLSSTLTATGSVGGYTWNPGALSGSSVSVSPGATTTYTVTGTLANGCAASSTVTLTITPPPPLPSSASPNTICAGGSSNLTANGSISGYTWAPAAGLSATNIANPVATPAATTTYTVTGTLAGGCATSNTVTVSIDVPGAYSFGNAGYSYVETSSSPTLQTPTDFTYEIWVRPTLFNSLNTYFENGVWGSGDCFIFRQENSSTIYVYFNSAVGYSLAYCPPLNAWTHLAVVRSGSTVSLYANGSYVGDFTTAYGTAVNANGIMDIGCSTHAQSSEYFHGLLDEFRLWNYARTPAEISADMHNAITTGNAHWANLKCYLKFNELSGTIFDRSSNTNNATPMNTPVYTSLYPAGVTITGSASPCVGAPVNYSVSMTNPLARLVYNWAVTGGAINSGQGTNTVNVTFAGGGAQSVSLNGGTIQHSDECQTESVTPLAVAVGTTSLVGIYTIDNTQPTNWPATGTNFHSFRDAIGALPCQSGNVTFNVSNGQTFNESNLLIDAPGTNAPTNWFIKFQEAVPAGVNPKVVAGTGPPDIGTGASDGFFILKGTDNVTFDGIDLQEAAGNVTTTTQMEWGYALLKNSATDGSQNCVIKNCVITLNNSNTTTSNANAANYCGGSCGIYADNVAASDPSTLLNVTATTGANSNNKFYLNTIQAHTGIYLYGCTTPQGAVYYYDVNNQIGTLGANTISNIGYAGGNNTQAFGIATLGQTSMRIAGNSITMGTGNTNNIFGMYLGSAINSSVYVYNNTITPAANNGVNQITGIQLACGAVSTGITSPLNQLDTVEVYNNTIGSFTWTGQTSGTFVGIQNVGGGNPRFLKIHDNTIGSITMPGTGPFYGILNQTTVGTLLNAGTYGEMKIYNNTITNSTVGGHCYSIWNQSTVGNLTVNNNTISNITQTNAAGYQFWGVYSSGGSPYASSLLNIYNNNISGLSLASTGAFNGLYFSNNFTTLNIHDNNVYNSTTASNTTNYGIYVVSNSGNTTVNNTVWNNTVHDLTFTGTAGTTYLLNNQGNNARLIYNNSLYNCSYTNAASGAQMQGIYINTLSAPSATTNLVYGNIIHHLSVGNALVYGINNQTANCNNIYNNNIYNLSIGNAASGQIIYGIYDMSTYSPHSVYGNNVYSFSNGGNGGSYGILIPSAPAVLNIYNNNVYSLSNTGTGLLNGINPTSTPATLNIYGNNVYSLSNTSGTLYGIYINSANATAMSIYSNTVYSLSNTTGALMGLNLTGTSPTKSVYQNTVYNLTSNGAAASGVTGIYSTGSTTHNIYKNVIYGLSLSGYTGAASQVIGLRYVSGTTGNIYNNMVSLTNPAPLSTNTNAVIGLYDAAAAGTVVNIYYNSVNIKGSGGTNFGSTALYTTAAATPKIVLINNAFVNNSTPNGTGLAVAHRRNSNTTTNFAVIAPFSNNNLYYAGTPGASNLIYFDGTNSDQTIAAYIARWSVGGQEAAAVTGDPTYTSASDLHAINATNRNVISHYGKPIAGYVVDFDGDARDASTPDLGFDEFTAVLPIELDLFTGKNQGNSNLLMWSTASETNNDYFTLERSADAQTFDFVGVVQGAGTSSSAHSYSFVDEKPYNLTYYRLKQTDNNGDKTFSNIVTLRLDGNTDFTFNLYPNPTTVGSTINIEMKAQKGEEVLVVVYDVLGNESYSKVLVVEDDNNVSYAIDPSSTLAPGVYMITATSNDARYSKRLIVR